VYDNSGSVALSAAGVAVLGQAGGAAAAAAAGALLIATALVAKATARGAHASARIGADTSPAGNP
jgi:hypothetical protein